MSDATAIPIAVPRESLARRFHPSAFVTLVAPGVEDGAADIGAPLVLVAVPA
jgi:hypothetical protein